MLRWLPKALIVLMLALYGVGASQHFHLATHNHSPAAATADSSCTSAHGCHASSHRNKGQTPAQLPADDPQHNHDDNHNQNHDHDCATCQMLASALAMFVPHPEVTDEGGCPPGATSVQHRLVAFVRHTSLLGARGPPRQL